MDTNVLTGILRTVFRISVALEFDFQISDSLRLEYGNAINNIGRLLANTSLSQRLEEIYRQLLLKLKRSFSPLNESRRQNTEREKMYVGLTWY